MKSLMNILLKSLISLTFCLGFTANAQDVEVIKNAPTDVKWEIQPNIIVDNDELGGYDRLVKIKFKAYENGYVQYAAVIESSGLKGIDKTVLRAVKHAKLEPYQKNGIYHSIITTQPFMLSVSREARYKVQPRFSFPRKKLEGKKRYLVIYAEADDNGNLTKSEIRMSSGLPELDDYALNEYRKQVKFYPLIINGKPHSMHTTMYYRFSRFLNTTD